MKSLGIKPEKFSYIGKGKLQREIGYKLIKLEVQFQCKFKQILSFLAVLPENPYLVGVEEFEMSMNKIKRTDVTVNVILSTYAL